MRVKKVLMAKSGEKFYVPDDTKDYHMQFGTVRKDEFQNPVTHSNAKEKTLHIIDADFKDNYMRMKRLAQIMHVKDLGRIISETGVGPESIVVDAGTGTGAAACFLARYVKHVISYDINEVHQAVARENAKELEITNITFKIQDITQGITERKIDLVLLDLPEPWQALETALVCLKRGGYLVTYSPTILQVHQSVTSAEEREDLIYIKTIEIIEREWHVTQKSVRPKMGDLSHTGFLSFFRNVRPT